MTVIVNGEGEIFGTTLVQGSPEWAEFERTVALLLREYADPMAGIRFDWLVAMIACEHSSGDRKDQITQAAVCAEMWRAAAWGGGTDASKAAWAARYNMALTRLQEMLAEWRILLEPFLVNLRAERLIRFTDVPDVGGFQVQVAQGDCFGSLLAECGLLDH